MLREACSTHPPWIQYPPLAHRTAAAMSHSYLHTSIWIIPWTLFSEIFNAEVLFREDSTPDDFIDVIVGNRVYMPCLYVRLLYVIVIFTGTSRCRGTSQQSQSQIYSEDLSTSSVFLQHIFFILVSLDLCVSRSTIKWIKSPLRKWTAWRADPTVLSSGQLSLPVAAAFFSFSAAAAFTSTFCWLRFSCGMKLNLDYLLEMLWEYLSLICIYTKKRGGT